MIKNILFLLVAMVVMVSPPIAAALAHEAVMASRVDWDLFTLWQVTDGSEEHRMRVIWLFVQTGSLIISTLASVIIGWLLLVQRRASPGQSTTGLGQTLAILFIIEGPIYLIVAASMGLGLYNLSALATVFFAAMRIAAIPVVHSTHKRVREVHRTLSAKEV